MNKSFLSNIVLLIIANLVIKPFYLFFIDTEVQNRVGSASYEEFFVFFNLCYILQLINDFGIHSYNLKEVSQNRSRYKDWLGPILGTKLCLGLLFFLSSMILFVSFGYENYRLFFLVAISIFCSSLILYFRSILSGLGYYRRDVIFSFLDKTILIIILLYGLYYSKGVFEIEHFVMAQISSFIISMSFLIFMIGQKAHFPIPSFSLKDSFSLLKKTAPFALVFFFMTAYSRVDALMLDWLITDSANEVDAFAACYRMFDAGNMFAYLFAGLILPMSAYLIKENKDLKPLMSLGIRIMSILVTILALSFVFFSEEILSMLYDRYNDSYSAIIKWLMLSFSSVAFGYIFGSIAVSAGKIKQLNWVFAFCLLANILLNFMLIPKHGALGAASASGITQLASLIGQIFICMMAVSVRWKWYEFWSIIVFGTIGFGVFYLITSSLSLHWISLLIMCIISICILALLMRFLQIKEFKELLIQKTK